MRRRKAEQVIHLQDALMENIKRVETNNNNKLTVLKVGEW